MSSKKPQGDVEQLRTFYYETLGGGKLDKVWCIRLVYPHGVSWCIRLAYTSVLGSLYIYK